MNVQAMETQDVFNLAGLTPDLLEQACRLLRGGRALLHARQSCALLHRIITSCIETLLAADGHLPVQAWAVYRNATALMIRLAKDENVELRRAHGRGCMGGFIDEVPNDIRFSMTAADQRKLDVLIKVLSDLPSRVRTIRWSKAPEIPVVDWRLVFTPSAKQSLSLARALASSACSQTLTSLQLDVLLSTAAVDLLGAALPALQHLDVVMGSTPKGNWIIGPSGLSLYASSSTPAQAAAADPHPSSDPDDEHPLGPQQQHHHQQQQAAPPGQAPALPPMPLRSSSPSSPPAWAPLLPPHLTSLQLHCEVHSCALDVSALAAAQRLQALSLTGELELVNTAALSALAALSSLHLAPYDDGLSPSGRLALLASLQALSDAALPMDCPVALVPKRQDRLWNRSSGGDSSASLEEDGQQQQQKGEEENEEEAAVAESLVSLAGGRWELARLTEQELPGCLARALPALRNLRGAATRQLPRLLAALQGAEQLTSLGASAWACDDADWSHQLAALPALQELDLHLSWYAGPSALVAAAACEHLQELTLDGGHKLPAVTVAAARALAGGACRGLGRVRLKGRQLHSWRRADLAEISVTAVAALFEGRLRELREVRLGGGGQAYRLQSCAEEVAGYLRQHEVQQQAQQAQQQGQQQGQQVAEAGAGRELVQQLQALADSGELTEALLQAARRAPGSRGVLQDQVPISSGASSSVGTSGASSADSRVVQQLVVQLQQCSISSACGGSSGEAGGIMPQQQQGWQQAGQGCGLDPLLLQRVQQVCTARVQLEALLPARGSVVLRMQHRGCSVSLALC